MENTMPPPLLQNELREKIARLESLESLVAIARKDSDFDLFYRRVQMAENFLSLLPEEIKQIHLANWYFDFWKLAGEYQRVTKFAEEEKNISQQVLVQAKQETNPIRRQYFALLLIVFGELKTAQQFVEVKLLPPQLLNDFSVFLKWIKIINNPLTPRAQAMIDRNDQLMLFLQEKYSALIKKHSQAVINEETCPPVQEYQIYFCWLQGEENLPPIVRCCYNSLKQNAGRYKIVFIDEKNFSNYVDIAPHIIDKFRAGKISRTHFSDVLRVNLLEQYGGLWLDSTILVTDPLENHEDLWQMPYFTQKFFHEKNLPYICFVSYGRWAGFIQGTSVLHNPLFAFEKDFYNEYWRDHDDVIHYLLMDFMMELAYENIPAVKKEIDAVPINNTQTAFIREHLNDSYAQYPFDGILNETFLHKLSWRIPLEATTPGTVFREIQRRYT